MPFFVGLIGRQGQRLVFMGEGLKHPQVHAFISTNINLDEEVGASHYLSLEGYGFKDIKLLIFFRFKLGLHLVGDLLRLAGWTELGPRM